MIWVTLSAIIAVQLLTLWGALYVIRHVLLGLKRLESAKLAPSADVDLEPLERKMAQLTIAVAEGIERVDRAESRVQTTLRSAQAKFAAGGYEHAGVLAEIDNLPDDDGAGSEGAQLQLVPENLAPAVEGDAPSGIPGMTLAQVEQIRTNNAAQA